MRNQLLEPSVQYPIIEQNHLSSLEQELSGANNRVYTLQKSNPLLEQHITHLPNVPMGDFSDNELAEERKNAWRTYGSWFCTVLEKIGPLPSIDSEAYTYVRNSIADAGTVTNYWRESISRLVRATSNRSNWLFGGIVRAANTTWSRAPALGAMLSVLDMVAVQTYYDQQGMLPTT